jgi:iron complex outermembrane receptor protein
MDTRRHIFAGLIIPALIAAAARAEAPSTQPAIANTQTANVDTEPTVLPNNAATTRKTPALPPEDDIAGGLSTTEDSPELMLFKDIPVVVAAGKREQTQDEAPASVSVITAEDIQLFGYQSLADALRNQRSFFLHTDGLNWFLGVRGFQRPGEWNARILVTVDGRPTNDLIYGQTHIDRDFVVPVEAMKQVEVIRGPGSSLYGTNAVFGVINVVTKDGADVNGLQARVDAGNKDTARASILYGQVLPGGWDVLACITGYSSNGDSDIIYDGVHDAAHNFGHIRDYDSEGVESALIKVKKGDFTAMLDYETRVKDNRSATYLASFYDPGNMHETRSNITLKYDHEIQSGQSIHAMLYYGQYTYYQDWLYAPAPPTPGYRYFTIGNDAWLGEEVHYDWQMTKTLHLLAGADGRQSLFTNQHDFDTLSGTILNTPASTNYWGIFVEAEDKITDWLSLTLGGRVDTVQRIGTSFSPRFATILTPTKEDTVKLLYGRAFRTPNLYELLYSVPGSNSPNPTLRSEICDTYEVVWEREFAEGWRTSAGGFLWRLSHALENFQFPDGSLQTRNGPTEWCHGAEVELNRRWSNGASFRIYGTFARAERSGQRIIDSPEWIVGTALVFPIYKNNTFLAIEPQVVGQMKDDLGNYVAATYITNVVLTSKDFVQGWDVQVGAYNLFANDARLTRDGPFNQFQNTLNYPLTQYLVSVTHRF